MQNHFPKLITRTFVLSCALLSLLALAACDDNSDSSPDTNNSQGDTSTNGLSIVHNGQTINANTTINSVNTFINNDKGTLSTTIIAGWADAQTDKKFGTVTTRLSLLGTRGEPISAGKYTLDPEELRSTPQTARFTIDNPELGLPVNLVSESGTLTVDTLDIDDKTLKSITLHFDGTFKNTDDADTNDYKLSGTLKYKK